MENASKALLMAVGLLIGIIILSFGIYLANSYRGFAKTYQEKIEQNEMSEFNAKFIAYGARKNVTMQEILTLSNIAKNFNNENNMNNPNESQYINVIVKVGTKTLDITTADSKTINSLLDGSYKPSVIGDEIGKFYYSYDEDNKNKKIFYNCYECTNFNLNEETGRIKSITFEFKKSYQEK